MLHKAWSLKTYSCGRHDSCKAVRPAFCLWTGLSFSALGCSQADGLRSIRAHMERAANGGDIDLEQEFKEAAMKLLQELKEKHFEGTGTLLKKVPTFAKRVKEETRPQRPAADTQPTSCRRRQAAGGVSRHRRPHKEDSHDGSVEVVKSRRRPSTARGSASVTRGSTTGRMKTWERSGSGREQRRSFSSRGPRGNVRGSGVKRAAVQRRGSRLAKR